MSRTLRSAFTLAQSLPGPSRPLRRIPGPPPTSMPSSRRSIFNFSNIRLPLLRSAEPKPTGNTTDQQAVSPPSNEPESSKGLFDEITEEAEKRKAGKRFHEHAYKSGFHKMSHRKLNMLSRQVAGLPVDEAVVQMAFSDKRAGRSWVKSTLCLARDHAIAKGLPRDRLVVAETWVSKGPKIARVDIKGRGRMGIKHHPSARIHFVLRQGKTWDQKVEDHRRSELGKIRSAGVVREDGKLRRKITSGWAW